MNTRTSEEREAYYKEQFIGKSITGIKIFQVDENYMELDENTTWVIDCGATIQFEGDKQLTMGWDAELELFRLSELNVSALTNDLEIHEVPLLEQANLDKLVSQKVKSMQFIWNYFEDIDDEREYVPNALYFQLENDQILCLAPINCEIEDGQVQTIRFDLEGELLISLDQEMAGQMGMG